MSPASVPPASVGQGQGMMSPMYQQQPPQQQQQQQQQSMPQTNDLRKIRRPSKPRGEAPSPPPPPPLQQQLQQQPQAEQVKAEVKPDPEPLQLPKLEPEPVVAVKEEPKFEARYVFGILQSKHFLSKYLHRHSSIDLSKLLS